MSTNNVLLFHVGTAKTGTSALQTFLYDNCERLEQYGWRYPLLARELPDIPCWTYRDNINGNIFLGIDSANDSEKVFAWKGLRASGEEWDRIWERILSHLQENNVIISEEGLWWCANDFLVNAKKKYENIKVVVYLRSQDQFIESRWNQRIKVTSYENRCFEEFCEAERTREIYHYQKKLQQINEIIGKENLIVRTYEKSKMKSANAIAYDFLSVLGVDPDWKEWNECSLQNMKLSGDYIEIKRSFNSVRNAGYIDRTQAGFPDAFSHYFSKLSETFCKGKEGGYFAGDERRKFMEEFKAENEQVAREYLNREDGVLFDEDKADSQREPLHRCTPFEESLIRTFSAILCGQNEEILQLKTQNIFLTWDLIFQRAGERKVAFWGGGNKCREYLGHCRFPIELIIDNDTGKKGTEINGIPVVHPEDIRDWPRYFIVVTCADTEEIEAQIQRFSLKSQRDYVLANDYFNVGRSS